MKSMDQLIAQANLDTKSAPSAVAPRREARSHKVHLCVNIYAEIDVMAETPEEAFSLAEKRVAEAKRTGKTAAFAYRAAIRRPVDWKAPEKGFKWVRLERVIDDRTGVATWREGRDDVSFAS